VLSVLSVLFVDVLSMLSVLSVEAAASCLAALGGAASLLDGRLIATPLEAAAANRLP